MHSPWGITIAKPQRAHGGIPGESTRDGLVAHRPEGARTVAALYRAHAGALSRYAMRLCGDPDTAADSVQEAFLRYLECPLGPDNPRAWLFTVVTNLVRDSLRANQRRTRLLTRERLPGWEAMDPLAQVESIRIGRQVREALSTLRDKERIAILMREEGFTHREIAAATGTTTRSVGTLLARAFRKLARLFPTERT